jgi:hypothetical protein
MVTSLRSAQFVIDLYVWSKHPIYLLTYKIGQFGSPVKLHNQH